MVAYTLVPMPRQTLKLRAGKMAQDPKYHTALGNAYRDKKTYDKALEACGQLPGQR